MQKRMVNASSRLRHRAFVFLRIFLMMLLLSRNACKAEFYVVIQPVRFLPRYCLRNVETKQTSKTYLPATHASPKPPPYVLSQCFSLGTSNVS